MNCERRLNRPHTESVKYREEEFSQPPQDLRNKSQYPVEWRLHVNGE